MMPFRDNAREIKSRFKSRIQTFFRNERSSTSHFAGSSVAPMPEQAPLASSAPTYMPSRLAVESMNESEGWTNLEALLNTLNQAARIGGLGPLKTIVEGLIGCVRIYEDRGRGRREYDELRVWLEYVFEELKQHVSASPVITRSVASICGSIQKEIEYIRDHQARPAVRRLVEAEMGKDQFLECYRRIHDLLNRLSRNANISTWNIVDELTTENRLEKLAPSLWVCYNSEKALELKRGPCTPGTRTGVLAQIHHWVTDQGNGNVYWMNGMAGTGKTTVAYSLCEQLDAEPNHLLCASFFCSRSLPECRNVGRIIPSIAYQLARYSQPFRYALSQETGKDPDAHTRLPHLQFDLLIVRPLSDVNVRQTFPTNMVIVIDALDECEDPKSTQQIFDVLLTKARHLPLKFVVSSRPEGAICDQMEKRGTEVDSQIVLHELDSAEVRMDIKTYLKIELAPIHPSELEVEKLADQAGLLFIYAATVIRYVSYDGFQRNPHARLKTVLYMTEQCGKAQTQEIDNLYTLILTAAFDDANLEERERDDMKLVLNTVICAQQPLTTGALTGLLELGEVDRVYAALRPLWSVLHVVKPARTVTSLHASFPDYMLDPRRSGKWNCDAATHNYVLYERCSEFIRNTKPQFNICGLESSFLCDKEVKDLEVRIRDTIPLELYYASRHWAAHISSSHSNAAPRLVLLLERFMREHMLLWMEVMNLTGNTGALSGCLVTAKRWAMPYPEVLRAPNGSTRPKESIIGSMVIGE
ncbi:hypothetical protein B0J17DRAFT_742724 [Rhizoctonia solani]|nr:hypothetical protein B0J17DRAFT_742724 [Rhizoctonia solani]